MYIRDVRCKVVPRWDIEYIEINNVMLIINIKNNGNNDNEDDDDDDANDNKNKNKNKNKNQNKNKNDNNKDNIIMIQTDNPDGITIVQTVSSNFNEVLFPFISIMTIIQIGLVWPDMIGQVAPQSRSRSLAWHCTW